MKNYVRFEGAYESYFAKTSISKTLREPRIFHLSSILKILYLPAGLFAYETIKSYSLPYLVILYLLFVYNVVGVAAAIHDKDAQPLENFYFMSSGTIVLISLTIARYHKDYLWHLYWQIIEHQKSSEFNRLSHTVIRSKLKYAVAAIVVPLIFIVVVPLYTILCTDAKTEDLMVLLYPMWYPWRRDTVRKYLCSLFMQYVSVLYGYYLMSFLLGSLVFACLFIRVRFILLGRKISRMQTDSRHCDSGKETAAMLDTVSKSRDDLHENFVQIVREHQILISFTKQTIECFTLISTTLVTYSVATAAFLITLFLKVSFSTFIIKIITYRIHLAHDRGSN
ncbi:uncharacterized protein LOC135848083 [Planococcus citri]|uniref:uncharacterized protein LOC135848083 n=1 Tax=Planococcus citri TaxID=170843 RepID=UPI0031F82E30